MLLSGVVNGSGAIIAGGRNGWGAQVDLLAWQIEGHPLEQGRLRVGPHRHDLEKHEALALAPLFPVDGLITFEAEPDEKGNWVWSVIRDTPVASHELRALHSAHVAVPPVTEPWHYARCAASCELSGADGAGEEWTERVSAAVEAPWSTFRNNHFGQVGFLKRQPVPDRHLGRAEPARLFRTIEDTTVRLKGGELDDFMSSYGKSTAEELGLEVSYGPTQVVLPAGHRREPLALPSGRILGPRDRAIPSASGTKISAEGYQTEVLTPGALAGREIRLWYLPSKEVDAAMLGSIDDAITNFLQADRSIVEAVLPLLHTYYEDIAEAIGWDCVPEIAEPADLWDHVEFSDDLRIEADRDDPAIIVLTGACAWYSHGLRVAFQDGHLATEVGEL